jgi:hypothetical protein
MKLVTGMEGVAVEVVAAFSRADAGQYISKR